LAEGYTIAMAEPSLKRPRVVTVIRQLVPAGMTKHVRVDWKRHPCALAQARY
jgi:hypothetical protein